MAVIPFVNKGDSITAEQMNDLFAEFDAKLSEICAGGKSFILQQGNLYKLMGRAFFFISGKVYHSQRVKGYVPSSTANEGVPYSAQETILKRERDNCVVQSYDSDNKIAVIDDPSLSIGEQALFPAKKPGQGYFDFAAFAATTADGGETYYLREESAVVNEKHYDWAVAEIIIEGNVTSVTIPIADFNKYRFFRVHNLTFAPVDVTFTGGSGHVLSVPALGCKTTRRLSDDSFQNGLNYFWLFRSGEDPQFFWSLPTTRQSGGTNRCEYSADSPQNAMVANNITNPAILFEFVNEYTRVGRGLVNGVPVIIDLLPPTGYWHRDPHVHAELDATTAALFGDPDDPDTLVGDLIHHKGLILKVETMKDEFGLDGTTRVMRFSLIEFKGWSSIVADFAAHGITVTFPAADQVKYDARGYTDRAVSLIPISTNLFCQGEVQTNVVVLSTISGGSVSYADKTYSTRIAFDEQGDIYSSNNTAPTLLMKRTEVSSANQRTWRDPEDNYDQKIQNGLPDVQLQVAGTAKSGGAIYAPTTKVSDLVSLAFWGSTAEAASNHVEYSGIELKLTVFGPVILFTETVDGGYRPQGHILNGVMPNNWSFPSYNNGYSANAPFASAYEPDENGNWVRKRCIKLRGWGWGYADPGMGTTFFLPPTGFPAMMKGGLRNRGTSANGEDLRGFKRGYKYFPRKILTRVAIVPNNNTTTFPDLSGYVNASGVSATQIRNTVGGGAVWELVTDIVGWVSSVNNMKPTAAIAVLSGLDTGYELLNGLTPARLNVRGTTVEAEGTEYDYLVFPMMSEHYNGMAAVVNSLSTGDVLSFRVLRFYNSTDNSWLGIDPQSLGTVTVPMPINWYRSVSSGEVDAYENAGLVVADSTDLPQSYHDCVSEDNTFCRITIKSELFDAYSTVERDIQIYFDCSTEVYPNHGYLTKLDWSLRVAIETEMVVPTSPISVVNIGTTASGNPTLSGFAFRRTTSVGNLTRYDLADTYGNLRWLRVEDVKDFIESLGFTFRYIRAARPLRLARLERPSTFVQGPVPNLTATYTQSFDLPAYDPFWGGCVGGTFINYSGPPPDYTPRPPGEEVPFNDPALTFSTNYRIVEGSFFVPTPNDDEEYEWMTALASNEIWHDAISQEVNPEVYFAGTRRPFDNLAGGLSKIANLLDIRTVNGPSLSWPNDYAFNSKTFEMTDDEKDYDAMNRNLYQAIVVITEGFDSLPYTLIPSRRWGRDYAAFLDLDDELRVESWFSNYQSEMYPWVDMGPDSTPLDGTISGSGTTVIAAPENRAYWLYIYPF